MKKFKKLILLIFLFVLTACSFGRPEDVTELIEAPKVEDPILKGTWQVSEIKKASGTTDLSNVKINDKLYIDKNLVALNDDYAYPPKFSTKYVNLKSYLEKFYQQIKGNCILEILLFWTKILSFIFKKIAQLF